MEHQAVKNNATIKKSGRFIDSMKRPEPSVTQRESRREAAFSWAVLDPQFAMRRVAAIVFVVTGRFAAAHARIAQRSAVALAQGAIDGTLHQRFRGLKVRGIGLRTQVGALSATTATATRGRLGQLRLRGLLRQSWLCAERQLDTAFQAVRAVIQIQAGWLAKIHIGNPLAACGLPHLRLSLTLRARHRPVLRVGNALTDGDSACRMCRT
jgi:hypothetical protein